MKCLPHNARYVPKNDVEAITKAFSYLIVNEPTITEVVARNEPIDVILKKISDYIVCTNDCVCGVIERASQ